MDRPHHSASADVPLDQGAATWQLREIQPGENLSRTGTGPMMEHEPEWLLAIRHPGHGAVLLAENGERKVPIQVHDGALSLMVGGLALHRIDIRRYVLTGNLPCCSEEDLVSILEGLRGHLDQRGVVFLIGVVRDEPLWQALKAPELQRLYRVLQSGAIDVRRCIRLNGSFAEYLASLPRDHRKDLKRRERRFDREFESVTELKTLTEKEELRAFLQDVGPVSERTYQSRLLNLGVGPGGAIERQLIAAAKRGQARCYGLYVGGSVVAWRIGFLYGGRYFSHHVGYDPDYGRWAPGIVLHVKSIRDLASLKPMVSEIDLLYGDNPAKRKLSNKMRMEGKFYLFPRDWRGFLRYFLLKYFNVLSDGLSGLASRLGIKYWIRRRLRQR